MTDTRTPATAGEPNARDLELLNRCCGEAAEQTISAVLKSPFYAQKVVLTAIAEARRDPLDALRRIAELLHGAENKSPPPGNIVEALEIARAELAKGDDGDTR